MKDHYFINVLFFKTNWYDWSAKFKIMHLVGREV